MCIRDRSDMIDYYTMWVHQIKTPISAMKLLIQTSESEISSDLSSELFKIEQYVEMVLSYIRLGSNENDFVIKEYDLDNIVRQAIRKYAPLFIRKKINLDFQPTTYKVLTDEKWLVFVIEQLLSNAIKYTNKGKISIYPLEDKKLVIEDTGIGISQEDIPRIFDKGLQVTMVEPIKRPLALVFIFVKIYLINYHIKYLLNQKSV